MGRFFNALKAGVASMAEGAQPRRYSIAGRPLKCPHCAHETFTPGRALLNATILVCSECGRIEWFAQEPDPDGE